jgi:hypothetical protein
VKNLDWSVRGAEFAATAAVEAVTDIRERLRVVLGYDVVTATCPRRFSGAQRGHPPMKKIRLTRPSSVPSMKTTSQKWGQPN